MFQILRALASRDYEEVAAIAAEGEKQWTPDDIEKAMAAYFEEHKEIRTDPVARSPNNTIIRDETSGAPAGIWEVTQIVCDPEGITIGCSIASSTSRSRGEPRNPSSPCAGSPRDDPKRLKAAALKKGKSPSTLPTPAFSLRPAHIHRKVTGRARL
jgi:hypothetical protein